MEDGYLTVPIRVTDIDLKDGVGKNTLQCPRLLKGVAYIDTDKERLEIEITDWVAGTHSDTITYNFRLIRRFTQPDQPDEKTDG